MAELALEQALYDEDWIEDYILGFHTDEEAYEFGYIDELGYLIKPINYKTCRCCGEKGLIWNKHNEKWRLFKNDTLHNCPVNPLQE